MTLTVSRIILTILLFIIGYFIWTKNVNLITWSKNKIQKMLPISEDKNDGFNLDFSHKQLAFFFYKETPKYSITSNPKIVLSIYHSSIVNKNSFSSTIKDIDFFFYSKEKVKKQLRKVHNIKTSKLKSGNSAIIAVTYKSGSIHDKIITSSWENLFPKIFERKVLLPGEVLSGSILIEIDTTLEEVKNIDSIELVISDFLGNTSKQNIKIVKNHFTALDKNICILNISFKQDENNKIIFTGNNE